MKTSPNHNRANINKNIYTLNSSTVPSTNKQKREITSSKSIIILPLKSHPKLPPKSPRRTTNVKKQLQQSYITKSFDYIESGCFNDNNGQLNIDGGIGDYRMKMFRNKDKIKYYNDPSSIFDEKSFTQKIWEYAYSGIDGKLQQNQKYLKYYVEESLSPLLKKANLQKKYSSQKKVNNQRARIGARRQNSMMSPGLKQSQQQKYLPSQSHFQNQQSSQLSRQLTTILSKPQSFYLSPPIQIQQPDKGIIHKGIQQQLREQQGHLFYRSIPSYMAEKWFKTVDNSTPGGNFVQAVGEGRTESKVVRKVVNRRTHLFRFLEGGCVFGRDRDNFAVVGG